MEMKIVNLSGETVATEKFDVEGLGPVNRNVLYYAVNAYRANQRQGNGSSKNRSEVSGGGKKPWRQKGTGRARVGSSRSPLWRTGGIAFGPKNRDFRVALPLKIRRRALVEVLKDKIIEQKILLLADYQVTEPKTKVVGGFLDKLNLQGKVLFFVPCEAGSLRLSGRNIPGVCFGEPAAPDFYNILNSDFLVIGRDCWPLLAKRLARQQDEAPKTA